MQINPKYTNNPAFNKSFPAISEVTSAKKSGGLGTITKFCSNQSQQGLQQDEAKYKEYRKQTQQLKERAGQIL